MLSSARSPRARRRRAAAVYADWLEEQGDSDRAEFYSIANRPGRSEDEYDAARPAKERRVEALFERHWRNWFAPCVRRWANRHTIVGIGELGSLRPRAVASKPPAWGDSTTTRRLQWAEFGRGFAERLTLAPALTLASTVLPRLLETPSLKHCFLPGMPTTERDSTGLISIDFRA